MSVKIKDLVRILQTKPQNDEIEFVVVRTDGMLVTMDLESSANDMSKILRLFTPKKPVKKAGK
jgi:hypothetical protein